MKKLVLALSAACVAGVTFGSELVGPQGGATLVAAENCEESSPLAAEEISNYVARLTGVALPIVRGAAAGEGARSTGSYGASGRIAFRADANGEPIVDLKDANGSCSVTLRGAHVIACRFAGDAHPLLYVPKGGYVAIPRERSFIHGGVPVLWPWFGSSGAPQDPLWRKWCRALWLPVRDAAPFHATARYSLFAVKAVKTEGPETSVTLALGPCDEVAEYTDGDFLLEYTITLGAHKLGLSLKTTNTGTEEFRYREGYHPYFAVSDCFQLTLTGAEGCVYESSRDLKNDCEQVWHGPVPVWPGCDLFKFTDERSTITIRDPLWKRDIVLATTGARDVVTWCQNVKGAQKGTMNIRPEEAHDFFCVEPANFYASSEIALAPGASHTFETIMTVVNQ